jgi:hypothetical protein
VYVVVLESLVVAAIAPFAPLRFVEPALQLGLR